MVTPFTAAAPARKRIVALNDDDLLEMYTELLEDEGYEALVGHVPFKHPRELAALHPDLIVLDLKFGAEYAGWSMLEKLSMFRPTTAIPVILCTAAVREVRDQEDHLRTRHIPVVYKPFEIEVFLQVVREALTPPQDDDPIETRD